VFVTPVNVNSFTRRAGTPYPSPLAGSETEPNTGPDVPIPTPTTSLPQESSVNGGFVYDNHANPVNTTVPDQQTPQPKSAEPESTLTTLSPKPTPSNHAFGDNGNIAAGGIDVDALTARLQDLQTQQNDNENVSASGSRTRANSGTPGGSVGSVLAVRNYGNNGLSAGSIPAARARANSGATVTSRRNSENNIGPGLTDLTVRNRGDSTAASAASILTLHNRGNTEAYVVRVPALHLRGENGESVPSIAPARPHTNSAVTVASGPSGRPNGGGAANMFPILTVRNPDTADNSGASVDHALTVSDPGKSETSAACAPGDGEATVATLPSARAHGDCAGNVANTTSGRPRCNSAAATACVRCSSQRSTMPGSWDFESENADNDAVPGDENLADGADTKAGPSGPTAGRFELD
jgi:hypothetical protein